MSGSNGGVSGLSCYVDSAGIHAPSYSAILSYLTTQYQSIYGSDVYLGNDTQDYQFLAILATAINDANAACIAAYNNFSPATAQGAGLSSIVKINGIAREVASASTIPVAIGGSVESNIINGVIADSNNNQWSLPALVIIPSSGTITVTATCQTAGAIAAAPQTFTIVNPQQGWQTAIAATAAIPGNGIELDGALRIRQSNSVAQASETLLQGLQGALLAINSGGRLNIVENATSATVGGVPANSIAVVIEGGNALIIAQTIQLYKDPGCGTFGSISETVLDPFGNSQTIQYSAPTEVTITVAITILASTIPGGGYTTVIGTQIAAAVAAYIAALPIGGDVYLNRLMLPANLNGGAGSSTYDVVSIQISRTGSGGLAASNIIIAYNEAAACTAANVTVTAT
jgi:uncharacterized phage protein gp47/JayE